MEIPPGKRDEVRGSVNASINRHLRQHILKSLKNKLSSRWQHKTVSPLLPSMNRYLWIMKQKTNIKWCPETLSEQRTRNQSSQLRALWQQNVENKHVRFSINKDVLIIQNDSLMCFNGALQHSGIQYRQVARVFFWFYLGFVNKQLGITVTDSCLTVEDLLSRMRRKTNVWMSAGKVAVNVIYPEGT